MRIDAETARLAAQCGKQQFPSAHAAREAAARVTKSKKKGGLKFKERSGALPGSKVKPRAYHCDICGHWHWGNSWGKS